MFKAIDISASGLTAERFRMNIISNNIANANTTRTESGEPFRRKLPVFQAREDSVSEKLSGNLFSNVQSGNGVRVMSVVEDDTKFKMIYNPGHPDANKEGYVKMPNVDVIKEMVDLISASRAYEANLSIVDTTKTLVQRLLNLGK